MCNERTLQVWVKCHDQDDAQDQKHLHDLSLSVCDQEKPCTLICLWSVGRLLAHYIYTNIDRKRPIFHSGLHICLHICTLLPISPHPDVYVLNVYSCSVTGQQPLNKLFGSHLNARIRGNLLWFLKSFLWWLVDLSYTVLYSDTDPPWTLTLNWTLAQQWPCFVQSWSVLKLTHTLIVYRLGT